MAQNVARKKRSAFVRSFPWWAAMLASVATGPCALAQAYPAKPIRYMIAFPPGGSNDILARIIGARMTELMGATVIIDNLADFNTLKDRLSAYGFTRTRVPHRMQHRDGGLLDLLPFSATMAPNGRRQLEDGVIFNMAGFSHVVPNAISTLYLSSLRGSQRARTSRLTSSQLKRTKRWNSPSSRRSWSPCMPKPRDWSSRSTPAPMPMHCTPLARSGHMSVA